MADTRSTFTYLPYSGFRALLACRDDAITQTMMTKVINDPTIKVDFPLEAEFAMLGRLDLLQTCWEKPNLSQHFHSTLGLCFAIRFNHPQIAQTYLDTFAKQNFSYLRADGKTPASTHIAAYLGKATSLSFLKKMADNPSTQESLKTTINAFDQFGNLPLHHAIAGGHKEFVEFLFENTSSDLYDLPELLIRALESNHASLVSLFINKIAQNYYKYHDDYFNKYGSFDEYVTLLLQVATTHYKENAGTTVVSILTAISDPTFFSLWVENFCNISMQSGFVDIVKKLVEIFPNGKDAPVEMITALFESATGCMTLKANLPELVIQIFTPLLTNNPKLVCDILKKIQRFEEELGVDEDELEENDRTLSKQFVRYLPKKMKIAAAEEETSPVILEYLKMETKSHHFPDEVATYHLFNPLKKEGVLGLEPLFKLYKQGLEADNGSPISYLCAAHVAFLLKKYTLARQWYEMGLALFDSHESMTVTASQNMVRQILVVFEKLQINLPAKFIETCANNLSSFIDADSYNFSLVHNAMLFIPSNVKASVSFKELYDAIHEIGEIIPSYNHHNAEDFSLLYSIKQSTQHLYNLFSTLSSQYNMGNIKAEPESIHAAKEMLALKMLCRNILEMPIQLISLLGGQVKTSPEISQIDHDMNLLGDVIEKKSAELAKKNEEKKRLNKEAEKNRQANDAIKIVKTKARNAKTEKMAEPLQVINETVSIKNIDKSNNNPSEANRDKQLKKLVEETKRAKEIEEAIKAEKKAEAIAKAKQIADKKAEAAKIKQEAQKKVHAKAKAKKIAEETAALLKREAEKQAEAEAKAAQEAIEKAAREKEIEKAKQLAQEKEAQEKSKQLAEEKAKTVDMAKHKIDEKSPAHKTATKTYKLARKKTAAKQVANNKVTPRLPAMPLLYQQLIHQHWTLQYTQHLLHQQQLQMQYQQEQIQRQALIILQQQHSQALQPEPTHEDLIYKHTDNLGIPRRVAKLYVIFGKKLFLVGGANRNLQWGTLVRDYDHVFFGKCDELLKSLPEATLTVTKPTFISCVLENHKVDIKILPEGTRQENFLRLCADAAARDFRLNTIYRQFTATGTHIIDCYQGNAKSELLNCHFEFANLDYGKWMFKQFPPIYFRMLFTSHMAINVGKTPTYSSTVNESSTVIKNNRQEFIDNCGIEKHKKAIRTAINKEIESYGTAYTYAMLVDSGLVTTVLASGVLTPHLIHELQLGLVHDFIYTLFSTKSLNGNLAKIITNIWNYLGEPNSIRSQAQQALLLTCQGTYRMGLFGGKHTTAPQHNLSEALEKHLVIKK